LTQRDPLSLVDKKTLEQESKHVLPLMLAFKWELVLGTGASAALGLSAYYLPHVGGSIGTVLSAFGITAAAVGSRAKSIFQSVGQRVQTSMSQDLVNDAVVRIPVKKVSGPFAGLRGGGTPPESLAALRP
jgi:hypothetical protein